MNASQKSNPSMCNAMIFLMTKTYKMQIKNITDVENLTNLKNLPFKWKKRTTQLGPNSNMAGIWEKNNSKPFLGKCLHFKQR